MLTPQIIDYNKLITHSLLSLDSTQKMIVFELISSFNKKNKSNVIDFKKYANTISKEDLAIMANAIEEKIARE